MCQGFIKWLSKYILWSTCPLSSILACFSGLEQYRCNLCLSYNIHVTYAHWTRRPPHVVKAAKRDQSLTFVPTCASLASYSLSTLNFQLGFLRCMTCTVLVFPPYTPLKPEPVFEHTVSSQTSGQTDRIQLLLIQALALLFSPSKLYWGEPQAQTCTRLNHVRAVTLYVYLQCCSTIHMYFKQT